MADLRNMKRTNFFIINQIKVNLSRSACSTQYCQLQKVFAQEKVIYVLNEISRGKKPPEGVSNLVLPNSGLIPWPQDHQFRFLNLAPARSLKGQVMDQKSGHIYGWLVDESVPCSSLCGGGASLGPVGRCWRDRPSVHRRRSALSLGSAMANICRALVQLVIELSTEYVSVASFRRIASAGSGCLRTLTSLIGGPWVAREYGKLRAHEGLSRIATSYRNERSAFVISDHF